MMHRSCSECFPQKQGFQNTLLAAKLQFAVARQNSVQIHHICNGNHWVTSSADEQGTISVYDSLCHGEDLSSNLKAQIASIYKTDDPSITVLKRSVRQQGGSDCGLFAVAFAYDIASGTDPGNVVYVQSGMRRHLKTCFEKGQMLPFPRRHNKPQQISFSKRQVITFCLLCMPPDRRI